MAIHDRPPEGTVEGMSPESHGPAVRTTAVAYPSIEVDLRKGRKGKKKRRTTAGLRDVEQFRRRTTRASTRFTRAIARGFRAYEKQSDKSSRNKRDGAIRDALENWSRGLGVSLRAGSDVPYDLARAVNTRTVRRQVRCLIRTFPLPFGR